MRVCSICGRENPNLFQDFCVDLGCSGSLVTKASPREYTFFISDSGVVLCDKVEGAFLSLRFKEDLENLKELLSQIRVGELNEFN